MKAVLAAVRAVRQRPSQNRPNPSQTVQHFERRAVTRAKCALDRRGSLGVLASEGDRPKRATCYAPRRLAPIEASAGPTHVAEY